MNVIAKISCYLERGVVTLKLRKEYLNSVTHSTSILLRIKYWTVWYIDRYSMSTYTGVTNFQKTVRFFGPPCICHSTMDLTRCYKTVVFLHWYIAVFLPQSTAMIPIYRFWKQMAAMWNYISGFDFSPTVVIRMWFNISLQIYLPTGQ